MKRADLSESTVQAANVVANPAARQATRAKAKKAAVKPAKAKPAPPHPPALVAFMMKDWKPQSQALPAPIEDVDAYAARRRALSKEFPKDVLVIPTGHEKTRANDTVFRFRPGSDFFYLTGNLEPDCVLVLEPKKGGHRDLLFVEPNPGRSDKTFFTDHAKGELWVGPRLGVKAAAAHFGVHETRGLPELAAYLKSLGAAAKKSGGVVRVLRQHSASTDALIKSNKKDDHVLAERLSELRLFKDAVEIAELDKVVKATKRGFEDVIRELKDLRGLAGPKTERQVEGVFNLRARVEGNDVGYGTIAASGANACILHWTRNDARLKKRDLLLLDAGIEGNKLYTADITRTVPISGKFSKAQREVYDLVCAAQAAALAAVKPGADFMEPNRAAQRVLAEGLVKLGILADAELALRPDQQLQKRYTLHNTSHMLGIDVHDCAKARQEVYRYGQLKPGMVLTVEPGLYFQPDDLTVPEKYRGIGVRIEDDVLVTERGMKNLSASIPREAEAVEAWMAEVWAR